MKIIVATPIYPPEIGGPATYVKELCERIREKHDITVVAYTDAREAFPGTKLISISKSHSLYIRLIKYIFALWKVSRGKNLIYVQNAMAAGLPVAIVSMFRNIPFIVKFVGDEAWERATQHHLTKKQLKEFMENPEGGLKIKMMMKIQEFVLRHASIVTTPSKYLNQEIIKAYKINPKQAVVNYNASENPEIIPFGAERVKHQIATTARLVAWKGIDGIIKAVAILNKTVPDVRLVIAGDGPELENLQKLANDLNVSDKVTFLGNVSRAETWQLRKNSEVYVLNSTYEGLPHTVLTSFASGIPTVATNISGTNEAVYHEKTGLLVEPGDSNGLANAIERLFNDPKLCEQLVKNGTELLKEKFSWETHIKNLNSIFESVVSKPQN